MQNHEYSYLDLCVISQLRDHVLSPEPALVFDANIESVLWVNAAGADFFGGDGVVELLSSRPSPSQPFIQQLRYAYEQLHETEILSRGFRVVRGLRSELIQCELSMITLPHGEKAFLLLCQDEKLLHSHNEHEIADKAVNSLNGFADAAAIIDDYTLTIAATRSFSDIDLSIEDLQTLVSDLRGEDDRLVKRPINALDTSEFAAGIARISDNPGRNLIVLARTGSGGVNEPLPATQAGIFNDEAADQEEADSVSDEKASDEGILQFDKEPVDTENLLDEIEEVEKTEEDDEPDEPSNTESGSDDLDESGDISELSIDQETTPSEGPIAEPENDLIPDKQEEAEFVFDESANATRFAWIIDEKQVFQSVSPELAEIVGPNAADVVGRRWSDVAAVFGFDENGVISDLLCGQDTWSGKSIMWPVQGTDLQVPIDLAALPAFGSGRDFEGFRGFGVIRTVDAILDPDETGLALTAARTKGWVGKQAPAPLLDDDDEEDISIRQILDEDDEDAADNIVQLPRGNFRSEEENQSDDLSENENRAFNKIGESLRETSDSEWIIGQDETDDEEDASEVEADNAETTTADEDVDFVAEEQEDLPQNDLDKINHLNVAALVYQAEECLFANDQMLDITGYDALDEIIDAGGIDALLESDFEEEQDDLDQSSNGLSHLISRNGEKMLGQMTLHSIAWQDDRALLLTFAPYADEDVSSTDFRRKAPVQTLDDDKMALEIAEVSQLQNILNTATDGIIVVDKLGTVESINAPAEALFGIGHSDISNQSIEVLFAVESHDAIAATIFALTNDEEPSKDPVGSVLNDGLELIGREANGGFIPLLVTFGKMGSSNKLCAVIRDMSSWKKAEEELVQARRQAEVASEHKSDFLARVSHEIRTPLNAIIGFSDVMIEERFGPIDNERYREYLRDINRSGIHVLDLINDLLDLSKIESGKMDLSFEAVDLNKIVSETVALMQPQANSQRIIIRTSLSRAVPKVVADARAMRQIIMNLVSNAIKFSQRNGQVIVSTVYESNGEVALRIRDTGIGMSDSELKDAMQPFHQIPGVSDKKGEGTGLGLPLTKALVDANRAHFDLESATGKGTIAHVQFPTQRVLAD